MSISAAQCRAARGLIGWSQSDLCNASRVGRATLANFESEKSTPYDRTLRDIQSALEAVGVTFLQTSDIATGAGVSLREPNGAAIDVDEFVQYSENIENDAPPGAGG